RPATSKTSSKPLVAVPHFMAHRLAELPAGCQGCALGQFASPDPLSPRLAAGAAQLELPRCERGGSPQRGSLTLAWIFRIRSPRRRLRLAHPTYASGCRPARASSGSQLAPVRGRAVARVLDCAAPMSDDIEKTHLTPGRIRFCPLCGQGLERRAVPPDGRPEMV